MVKPDTALALFGLQHYEVIYEPISETLGVVGWGGPGSRRIVLSFRGTSNMQVGALVWVGGSGWAACAARPPWALRASACRRGGA